MFAVLERRGRLTGWRGRKEMGNWNFWRFYFGWLVDRQSSQGSQESISQYSALVAYPLDWIR